jgi:hypothetical protein
MTPNTTTDAVQEKSKELYTLITPHRASGLLQRVNLYVMAKTGKKLPDYINNGATPEDKIALLDELAAIIRTNSFEKLPAIPSGQAAPVQAAPVAAAPAPVAAAPVALTPAAPVLKPAAPVAAAPVPVVAAAPAPQPVLSDDPAAQLAALITRLTAKPAAPAAPSMTPEQIRALVRAELAIVFTTISEVLENR